MGVPMTFPLQSATGSVVVRPHPASRPYWTQSGKLAMEQFQRTYGAL